ncbi:hypothetical protein H6778_03070 [Candidatus Nomurabacteria bacterium]|nr:hypothetical protein [Candidatus Nomurabacteria bacterium]
MINLHTKHFTQSALYALVASCTIVTMVFMAYFLAEPAISHGQADTATFYVRQSITDESSFLVNPSNITMTGPINGVTGGQATGTTQFVVQSNNSAGYYVEIDFFDNGTSEAMLGDETASESLRNYSGATSTPSFGYTASTAAQFAYTVTSTTSSDTGPLFLNNTTICGAGAVQSANTCWMTPSTTPIVIVDRDSAATTGATSTITFNVTVPSGATPVPQAETYTATATLSLFVK